MAGGDTGQGYVNEIVDMANSGNTSGFTRADWQIIANNPGYTTPRAAAEQQAAAPQGSGGDDSGNTEDPYNFDTDPETMRMREQQSNENAREAARNAQFDAQKAAETKNAIAVIKGIATDYGLVSLYDKMVSFITDGYNAEAVMSLIRDTSEYKTRFPAMAALMSKGRNITENDYINYEKNAAQLEQMYGLPKGMVLNNVTALLTNEVSGDELRDRVVLSSAASVSAPQQLKDSLKNYYGIDSGGLAAYFLDPAIAAPILEKQFATSVIGSEALRQDVNLGLDIASDLQEMGVTQDQAQQGFGTVSRSKSLTRGKGDTVNQTELVKGTFGQENEAKKVERTRQSRKGRFEAGGSFVTEQGGVTGVGSSST
jgi:hypothetical protein